MLNAIKQNIIKNYAPCFIQKDRARRALFVLKGLKDEDEKRLFADRDFVLLKEEELIRLSLSETAMNRMLQNMDANLPPFQASELYTAARLYLPYRHCEKEHVPYVVAALFFLDEKKQKELAYFMQHCYADFLREGKNPPPLAAFAIALLKAL